MTFNKKTNKWSVNKLRSTAGFTLIEIMIVLVMISILVATVISSETSQRESFVTQQSIARIQQDLRGALLLMQYDFMNAGRVSGPLVKYGVDDIRHYGFAAGTLDNIMPPPPVGAFPAVRPINFPAQQIFNSFPVLEFTSLRTDTDGDGVGDRPLKIRYQVFDWDGDSRLDLCRRLDFNDGIGFRAPELVAEGVIAIGYVFAFDNSPDGHYKLTRDPVLNTVIWAADTTGNGLLDTNIDRTGDGFITAVDDINNDGTIDGLDPGAGGAFPGAPLEFIRAVKISILLQSERPSEEKWIDQNRYVVGNHVIPPGNQNPFWDRYRRRVKTITVAMRNFRQS